MVAPLNLAHPNLLTPGDSLQCVQDFDRVLDVSQIILYIQLLQWQLFLWYPQTPLQLCHVEYVVHI